MPFRALVAGFLTTTNFARPGTTNVPDFLSSLWAISANPSTRPLTFFLLSPSEPATSFSISCVFDSIFYVLCPSGACWRAVGAAPPWRAPARTRVPRGVSTSAVRPDAIIQMWRPCTSGYYVFFRLHRRSEVLIPSPHDPIHGGRRHAALQPTHATRVPQDRAGRWNRGPVRCTSAGRAARRGAAGEGDRPGDPRPVGGQGHEAG